MAAMVGFMLLQGLEVVVAVVGPMHRCLLFHLRSLILLFQSMLGLEVRAVLLDHRQAELGEKAV